MSVVPVPPVQSLGWLLGSTVNPGTPGPPGVVEKQSSSTWEMPFTVYALETHTNAGRPVKRPAPPRTTVLDSPSTSQLKPARGDHSGLPLGTLLVSMASGPLSTVWLRTARER